MTPATMALDILSLDTLFAIRLVDAVAVALFMLIVAAVAMTVATLVMHALAKRVETRQAERWGRWERTLLDALAGERDPTSIGRLEGPGERGDFLQLVVEHALRVRGRSLEILAAITAPHLDASLRLLRHRRPDRRALGVHLLGLVGAPSDHRRLVPFLRDPSPGVAMTAARALARSGDVAFVRPLLDELDRFQTWSIASVASMFTLFGPSAGPLLLARLADDRASERTRMMCAEALRRLSYIPAAKPAAGLLSAFPTPPVEVRAAILRLIRDIGSGAQAPAVRPLVESDEDVLRLHALSALAALGHRPDDVERLAAHVSDPSPWVAIRAARGLVESGHADALRAVAAGGGPRAATASQALSDAGLPI